MVVAYSTSELCHDELHCRPHVLDGEIASNAVGLVYVAATMASHEKVCNFTLIFIIFLTLH